MREIQMQGQHHADVNPAFEPGPLLTATLGSTDLISERALRVAALHAAATWWAPRSVSAPAISITNTADVFLTWLKAGDADA